MDIFRFTSAPTANVDPLTDFSVADDTLQLENTIFSKFTTAGVLAAALDLNDYVVYNATTGALSYDADGNDAGAAMQIVVLGVNLALTNADFAII